MIRDDSDNYNYHDHYPNTTAIIFIFVVHSWNDEHIRNVDM